MSGPIAPTCHRCDQPIAQKHLGRPRLYCSDRCRIAGPKRHGSIPSPTLLRKPIRPASCHPERGMTAKGLCSQCYHRVRRSGLTATEAFARPLRDDGPCKACGDVAPLMLDHDHRTGRARGLLCDGCNRALGSLRDDPQRIKKLGRYLADVLHLDTRTA